LQILRRHTLFLKYAENSIIFAKVLEAPLLCENFCCKVIQVQEKVTFIEAEK
jgi:hypothetical protein